MEYPKRILIRACCPATQNFETIDVIKNNYVWNNTGNMIFAYAMVKLLSVKGVQVTEYRNINPKDAKYINENYDCFVIPLANAFRISFMKPLEKLTKLIKKLKIPCIVVGVGLQTSNNPDAKKEYKFDKVVKKFVKEVLKKSEQIGVRGEFTKKYLLNLGFDEKRINVIGCPSMYMNGKTWKINKKEGLDENSIICMNGNPWIPEKVLDLFENIRKEYKNNYFIFQEIEAMSLMYAGIPLQKPRDKYISLPSDKNYIEGKCRMFTNPNSWFDFLRKADFSVGCRIHGNIVSLISGTPCFIFTADSRTQELAEFHGIPHKIAKECDPNLDLKELYKSLDFSKFYEVQPKNFDNFIKFLETNNLDHIYNYDGKSELDDKIKNIKFNEPVKPLFEVSKEEAADRLIKYSTIKDSIYDRKFLKFYLKISNFISKLKK